MAAFRLLPCIAFPIILFSALVLLPGASHGQDLPLQIDSIYSFGDSLTDTGNLVRQGNLGQFSAITSFPYGKSIGKATGRCSDGYLMIDFIAKHLGLPYPNPYLDRTANFDNGVNFAVAGATALDASELSSKGIQTPYTNSSLNVQLNWFGGYLKNLCSPDTECTEILKNSLFMLGEVGGNDYNYAFIGGQTIDQVTQLVPSVVQSIIDAARKLINHGAKYLVVPGNFPIGCFPVYLTLFQTNDTSAYDERNCLANFNAFAETHNKQLQDALKNLSEEFPDVNIHYADQYTPVLSLIDNAQSDSGCDKKNALTACCGTGGKYDFSPTKMCDASSSVCDDLSSHIHWDGIHLTQQSYKKIVTHLVSQGTFFA